MKRTITAIFGIALLVFVAAGCSCSFTTANISKLEFGKNETATPAATTFDISDKIYAVATVSNTSEKLKMTFKVSDDKGKEVLNKSIDFDGARPIWLTFSPAAPGDYTIEATMSDADGKKIDSKNGKISVKGTLAPPPAAATDTKKDDADKDEDDN
jgi:hypothetical protein